jgi:hypothetical protein
VNKDGAITLEEYNQVAGGATPAGPSKPAATPAGNAGAAKTPSPMEWFNQADRNKDGKLSPPTPDPDFQGFGVLRKDTANGSWLVDLDLGPRPYRVEVMASVSFTTDAQGRKLEQPARY